MSRPGEIAKPNVDARAAALGQLAEGPRSSASSYGSRQRSRCFGSSFGAYTYAFMPRRARNSIVSTRAVCVHGGP